MTNQETSIMNTYINDIIPVPEERGYYNSIDDNVYLETRYMIQMLGWIKIVDEEIGTTSCPKIYHKESIRWSHVIPMINECIHICREEGILFKDFNIYIDYTKENLPNYLPSQIVFYLGCNGRSQAAKEFRIRLFLHIIPEIQRKGQYITKQKLEEQQKQIEDLRRFKEAAQPAVNMYDEAATDDHTIPITVIASNYGLTAQQLNNELNRLGFMFPCGNGWSLYEPYRSMGLAKTRLRKTQNGEAEYDQIIGFNEKGRLEIDKLLHSQGLLTNQERMFNRNAQIQQCNQQTQPMLPQQQTIINNYFNQPLPGQPGYRPNEATVIGPDGRLYDNQGRLVVIVDKDGYPYGYKR